MELIITARHFKPSSQLRELISDKVSKVSKFSYDISRCEVILTKENSHENVEIIAHVKGQDLIVNDSSDKFEKSLMSAVDKIISQAKKHHDKMMGKVKNHNQDYDENE